MPDQTAAHTRPTVELSDEDVPHRVTGAVEAVVDEARILLAPRDFSYFGLTGCAGAVWDGIDGETNVGALISGLEAEFTAEPGEVRRDTLRFLDALMAAGLVALSQD
jgi:hypothetical protein